MSISGPSSKRAEPAALAQTRVDDQRLGVERRSGRGGPRDRQGPQDPVDRDRPGVEVDLGASDDLAEGDPEHDGLPRRRRGLDEQRQALPHGVCPPGDAQLAQHGLELLQPGIVDPEPSLGDRTRVACRQPTERRGRPRAGECTQLARPDPVVVVVGHPGH